MNAESQSRATGSGNVPSSGSASVVWRKATPGTSRSGKNVTVWWATVMSAAGTKR